MEWPLRKQRWTIARAKGTLIDAGKAPENPSISCFDPTSGHILPQPRPSQLDRNRLCFPGCLSLRRQLAYNLGRENGTNGEPLAYQTRQ